MELNYDKAKSEPIVVTVRGESYEYPPEAPIDTAIEWMDRQTKSADELKESAGDYMRANYKTVLGADRFEAMARNNVGAKTVDTIYRDLLDKWGIWKKPEEVPTEHGLLFDRLETIINATVADDNARLEAGAIIAELRTAVTTVEEEDDAVEEVEAGNPA